MADSLHSPPPGSAQPGLPEEVLSERRTLRDYLIILRERLWIALPLALLVAIGLGYHKAGEVPRYAATATMQFEKAERVVSSEKVVDPTVTNELDFNTRLEVLRSDRIRRRVVESLTPDEIRILQRPFLQDLAPGQEPPSVWSTLGSLSVNPVRNSFIIRITVDHRDPQAAALLANRYVRQFIDYLLLEVGSINEVAVEFLKNRAEELRIAAERAQTRLSQYQKEHNLLSLDNSTNIVQSRLLAVNAALQTARLERLTVEESFQLIEEAQLSGKNLLEISYISNHGTIPGIVARLDELRRNRAVLAERYLERHPLMVEVGNNIAIAEEQLAEAIDLAIADIRTRLENVRSQEAALQREFEEHERDQMRLRNLAVEYRSLEDQANVEKNTYIQILDRLNQTTTIRSLESIPIRPLDPAFAPGAPYAPNMQQIIRNSVLVFLLVFLGVAFGLNLIDDRIKSSWDVESFIGTNLLGIVPDLGDVKDEEKHRLISGNQQAPGTESFLSIYSSVKIHSKLDFPKSILVTSTIPGEGKTLISSNLAASFARHGKRTLLVDCDLRRPMLHRHFSYENDQGLLKWHQEGGSLEGSMVQNQDLGIVPLAENLYLLRSGGRSKLPTELLESVGFGQLLDQLKREFELVVIDSPPLGAVTDSMLIANQADEVIYVCRFNRAFRKHIKLYVKALRNGKNDVLGIVLNGLSPRRIEYYSNYRYYRSYKKYYGAEA
jgi:capsular exopolysaccharide synthesis family protein